MVLLHPHAQEIAKRLDGFKGRLEVVEGRFGQDNIESVCQAVAQAFARG